MRPVFTRGGAAMRSRLGGEPEPDPSFGRADYSDTFALVVPDVGARSAEDWIRLVLGDAPAAIRATLMSAWTLMSLRLHPGERAVLGWTIVHAETDAVVVDAGSRIGMPAQLSLRRHADRLTLHTFVRFENRGSRALWSAVTPVHRLAVPSLLADAGRRASR